MKKEKWIRRITGCAAVLLSTALLAAGCGKAEESTAKGTAPAQAVESTAAAAETKAAESAAETAPAESAAETAAAETEAEETAAEVKAEETAAEKNDAPNALAGQEIEKAVETEAEESEEADAAAGEPGEEATAEADGRTAIPGLMVKRFMDYKFDEIEGEYRQLSDVRFDSIHLSDESAAIYPELDQVLNGLAKDQDDSAQELLDGLTETGREMYEMSSRYYGPMYDYYYVHVRRADTGFVSWLGDWSSYMGGAHGMYGFSGHNYETKTGKEVRLEDIVSDPELLGEMVIGKLYEDYDKEIFFESMEDTVRGLFKGEEVYESSFTLEPDGITFWFNPYEIAPYASNIQTVHILYKDAPELFDPRLTETALDNYAVELALNTETKLDLGRDGKMDTFFVEAYDGEYDEYKEMTLRVNGLEYKEENMWVYQINPILVHAYEHDILLAGTVSDNEYDLLYIYDVNEDGVIPFKAENLDLTGEIPKRFREDYNGSWRTVMTDTSHFEMMTGYDILSTTSACRWYGMGAQDILIPETDYYDMNSSFVLTTKIPMQFEEVDPEKNEVFGSVEVPAGTELTFFRTDNDTWTDMKDKEGNVYRIKLDEPGEWPHTIGGRELEECFDGILFAG